MKVHNNFIKAFGALLIAALLFAALPMGAVKAQTTHSVCLDGSCDFTTIQGAINAASAGDIVEVQDGTYTYITEGEPAPEGLIKINKPITLKAADDGNEVRPVIDGTGFDGIFKIWHSTFTGGEVVIEGFDLVGDAATGIAITAAMCDTADPTKIVIRDNVIHGMIGGFNAWGSGNFCTDTGEIARAENIEIIGNEFHTLGLTSVQGGFGVYLEGLSDWTSAGDQFAAKVESNVFRDILFVEGTDGGAGIAINSPNAANGEAANVRVAGNIFESTVPVGAGIQAGDVEDAEFVNNSFAAGVVGIQNGDAGILNAAPNWWGSASGPEAGQVVGNIKTNPWCYTADCTELYVAEGGLIQDAIDAAPSGGIVRVGPGTYVEDGQIVIDKNLTIVGADKTTTIIKPAQDTTNSGDARGWFLVQPGVEFNLSNVTLDGEGKQVYQGIRSWGTGTIDNNIFKNIKYGTYLGTAVVTQADMTFSNNTFTDIGRQGMFVFGSGVNAVISGNTYTGKGEGDWLDYGVEVGGGATATITGNTISDCLGVASSDGSASAGVLVTDLYGPGTGATVDINALTNNTFGIAIGYDETDASVVTATGNTFTANEYAIDAENATNINIADALANNTFDKAVVIDSGLTIYSSIQEAIDDASDGDIINVYPGTYEEALELHTPNITVQSTSGADETILDVPDGTLTTGVKVLANMGTVTFDGFTVKDFTESGIIQGMSAREGTTFHVLNNKVVPAADYLRNGIQVTGDGSTVIGNYIEGAYLTEDWAATAIGVVNASGVIVEENEISGAVNGIDFGISVYTWDYDGTVVESSQNVQVLNNIIYNVDYPLDVTAYTGTVSDITFEYNHITNYVEPIWAGIYDDPAYDGVSVTNIDASPNWWGSMYGPQGTVTGDVQVIQWCADETCTTFLPDENNEIHLSGNINVPGGIQVNVPGVTYYLANGTVIQNSSACFEVNADYTTITTESIGGAVCKPTGDDNGINVNGDRLNIVIEGLEIDGSDQVPLTTGVAPNGIDFDGTVTDLVVRDNFIHDMAGDGMFFAAQPAGTVQIQGNLFKENGGNGIEAGTFTIPAEYNAWGHVEGAGAGDGISSGVDADPYTHVDLYMVSTNPNVDNWPNQVFVDGTITYQVKAHMVNTTSADFEFSYPTGLLTNPVISNQTTAFVPATGTELVIVDGTAGVISFDGFSLSEVTGDIVLFEVTFDAVGTAGEAALDFDDTADLFGMSPSSGPSNYIYATELVDSTLDVIDRPTITVTDGLDTPLIAGLPRVINTEIVNPATGGEWIESVGITEPYDGKQDAIAWIRISDVSLAEIASLEFMYEGEWFDFSVQDTYGGTALQEDNGDVIARYGNYDFGFEIPLDWSDVDSFRVTFLNPGTHDITVEIYDMMDTAQDFIGGDDILLASYTTTITVDGAFDVTGTISMQGRSVRSGVPVTLTTGLYDPITANTINVISNNLTFTGVNGGTYTITTLQPRYLNVMEAQGKAISISGAYTFAQSLELKGGNAYWLISEGVYDNEIDTSDASVVGSEYGGPGAVEGNSGDVNFDGIVNILDLSLVGGNFGLTSATYDSWTP